MTLRAAAGRLLEAAGAPPEALDPLMRRVIENGFELTGPIARGDWETVERHLEAIREHAPELEELYLVLAEATADVAGRELAKCRIDTRRDERVNVARTIADVRRELARPTRRDDRARADDGRAARRPPLAPRAPPARSATRSS